MARKRKPAVQIQRPSSQTVQLKLRLPEWMRRDLEHAARDAARSMNSEILVRLRMSFVRTDFYEGKMTKLLAKTLVESLDDGIIEEIVNIRRRIDAEDAQADAAGDKLAEEWVDLQREGGPEEEDSK